jgi:Helicase HerA, central domain
MGISNRIIQPKLFDRTPEGEWSTGHFVGRPFRLSYSKSEILVTDSWKEKAKGIPQGCFLLAYYDNEMDDNSNAEAMLLRVLQPTKLPTDQDVISSMVEYYKDGLQTGSTSRSQLDTFTRYEFSFSGLECSVLGSFYLDKNGKLRFGADLENFYSAHHYKVIKPSADILKFIVNYREDSSPGSAGDVAVGKVRYSSSQRFQQQEENVPVYVQAPDFAGKRTALFGMTRTGKSNTVKTIIQACVKMSSEATHELDKTKETPEEVLKAWTDSNSPKYPIGQIIFDINGEYANPNLQDAGTAIFDLYKDQTIRYSTISKNGFKEMKVNFYREVETGFELICAYPSISSDSTRFLSNFKAVSLLEPENYGCAAGSDISSSQRHDRRVAAYLCCLHRAGFPSPPNFKVKFIANQTVREAINSKVDPKDGMTLDDAANWWERLWEIYETEQCFVDYKRQKDKEWADDDLKSMLVMLTRKRRSGGTPDCSGFRVLKAVKDQHTIAIQDPFDEDILSHLRKGKIVIVDLSLGEEGVQKMFTERITRKIFQNSLARFVETKPNNFIQFYFEEAHNLFPKKDDKDLSQIYNRLAKEGAKLNLGLIYATQEVSSISSNILKATQNWFISHLNNEDETRELRKYYDFSDFTESLVRFSQDTDKGFVRMKTYSNSFVIPVQINRFPMQM